jgi:hypothetical protein
VGVEHMGGRGSRAGSSAEGGAGVEHMGGSSRVEQGRVGSRGRATKGMWRAFQTHCYQCPASRFSFYLIAHMVFRRRFLVPLAPRFCLYVAPCTSSSFLLTRTLFIWLIAFFWVCCLFAPCCSLWFLDCLMSRL